MAWLHGSRWCDGTTSNVYSILKRLRWQFVSPGELLRTCRAHNAAPLRRSPVAKEALCWLLGQGKRPSWACDRRRAAYSDAVEDNRPLKQALLVKFLLEEPEDARGQAGEALAAVAKATALAAEAEARARRAEARAQAAEEDTRTYLFGTFLFRLCSRRCRIPLS